MAIPNWITLSQRSGNSGTTVITVNVSNNQSLLKRSGLFTVSCVNATNKQTVSISQNAMQPPSPPPSGEALNYFTMTALQDGDLYWRTSSMDSMHNETIKWNKNNTGWHTVSIGDPVAALRIIVTSVVAGDKIEFCNYRRTVEGGLSDYYQANFDTTFNYKISGNIMSLQNGDGFSALTSVNMTFKSLFDTHLKDASELVLPATTLCNSCYAGLFKGCTALVFGPYELPANTVSDYAYSAMFAGCTSLLVTPKLPALNVGYGSYANMFAGCTSLREVLELPAPILVGNSFNPSFVGGSKGSYVCMFSGCTSLNYIGCFATDIPSSATTAWWTRGVASKGTFVKDSTMSGWTNNSDSGIPPGWVVTDVNPSNSYVSRNSLSFMESGESKSVKIKSLGDWTATTSDNWIIISQSSGTSGFSDIIVSVTEGFYPNKIEKSGTITINVSNNGNTEVLVINISLTPSYLTFKVLSDGDIHWKQSNSSTTYHNVIEYSKDKGSTWTSVSKSSSDRTIPVQAGDIVWFKGNNNTYAYPSGNTFNSNNFKDTTCQFEVEGNIMSLIYGDNFSGQTVLPTSATNFYYLFQNCTGLTSAENLILPATTLTNYCYANMFAGCTSLTKAPDLPATSLGDYSYRWMFVNCTSLTKAPALSATSLGYASCQYMFYNCSNMVTAPAILPATALTTACYSNMFNGCSSLTTAPALPATTLEDTCYAAMFAGCASLTTAPDLPATTLSSECYRTMFRNCTSLNYIKCLAIDKSALGCTTNWVSNVSSTGTFVKNPSMSGWTRDDNGIPSNWTVEDAS